MKLFRKLINKQRGKQKFCVNERSVNDTAFKSNTEIVTGWREHFETLATPSENNNFD